MLTCLAFAIPAGGIGLAASWDMASSALYAWNAREWVKVDGQVISVQRHFYKGSLTGVDSLYRYTYKGQDYRGTRLTTFGSNFSIGSWHEEMKTYLESARDRKRPITVYVNPASPMEAIVDRTIRWPVMFFLAVAVLVMGGVAVGALVVAWSTVARPAKPSAEALAKAEGKRLTAREPGPPPGAPQESPRTAFVSDGPHHEFSPREAPPAMNVPIPPDIATIQDLGGRITIRYEGDAAAALYGRLTVIAGDGQLRVERSAPFGLFKRKDLIAPQSSIVSLGASHSNTDTLANPVVRYYSLWAATNDNPHVTIGRRLPGEAVANALLLRIARVLKFSADKVWIARAPSS